MTIEVTKYVTSNLLVSGNKSDSFTSWTDTVLEKLHIFKPGIQQKFIVSTEQEKDFPYCFYLDKEIIPTIISYRYNNSGLSIDICSYGLKEFFGFVPEIFYIKEI